MKKIFLFLLGSIILTEGMAQEMAPDFTASDCNLTSHNLYTELAAGKTIVLDWIMPCGACNPASLTAYHVVQNFAISNPGKVKMYVISDLGDDNCSVLLSYASSLGIVPDATFDNFGTPTPIDQLNYGGMGMPHIVVIAPTHEIFFNGKGPTANDSVGITGAIQFTLAPSAVSSFNNTLNAMSITVGNQEIKMSVTSIEKNIVTFSIIDMSGKVIYTKRENLQIGINKFNMPTAALSKGIYLLRTTLNNEQKVIKFVY